MLSLMWSPDLCLVYNVYSRDAARDDLAEEISISISIDFGVHGWCCCVHGNLYGTIRCAMQLTIVGLQCFHMLRGLTLLRQIAPLSGLASTYVLAFVVISIFMPSSETNFPALYGD